MARGLLLGALLAAGCARRGPAAPVPESTLEQQQRRAAKPGPDQTLERARLASLALAEGDLDLAERTLRQMVQAMQDFRADGEFRALVGQESSKEWKGDPSEKMMAFLYLGLIFLEKGDYGNALAMSKSAILADTGTSREQYRADFVPAYVMRALAYQGLGKRAKAEQAIEDAIDAVRVRILTGHLVDLLDAVVLPDEVAFDLGAEDAARALLVEGLPAGLRQHPRDPEQAVRAALGRATDLRLVVLETPRKRRPGALGALRKGDARDALEPLGVLAAGWRDVVWADPMAPLDEASNAERFLRELVEDPPSLVLWLEGGRAPARWRVGDYGQILQLRPHPKTPPPEAVLDGRPLTVRPLDSVAFQATTRGSRAVDGFLRGKAVFKDTAGVLGLALLVTGDAIEGTEGAVLQLAGAVLWIGGALTNPAADVRGWTELPDQLWLVRADPAPGEHRLQIDGNAYTVSIPDRGTVSHLIPGRSPGGVATFGEPCQQCEAPSLPLAIPGPPRGEP